MSSEVGIRELKDSLSEVMARVEAGEVVTVTRHGHAVATLVPAGVPAGLARLVADGRVRWNGQRMRAPGGRPVVLRGDGPSSTDYVREGRR